MKDCGAASLEHAQLDPLKLPNYVTGMILGPDDFRQVPTNFDWKIRNTNALLHGFGTSCGLKVSAQPLPDGDVQISVSAGFAVSPLGKWIRIASDQCASLNDWLKAQASKPYASPGPGAHRVYVTLCYAQCLTDQTPIAGRQCALDDSNLAPSRILQSYALQFAWTPPAQPLEDRARVFGALLRSVEIVNEAGSLPDDHSPALLAAVRALAQDPPPLSPPAGPFRLAGATAEATIRQAFTIWVTEVCPKFRPRTDAETLSDKDGDDCLLLAAIDLTIDAQGRLGSPSAVIDESQRPILAPTRILQELLLWGGGGRVMRTGTVTFSPGGNWAQFATLRAPLIDAHLAPDAAIELSIETSTPAPFPAGANLALTLLRPATGSIPAQPSILATYLSTAPLTSVTVRWRAYQG